MVREPLAGGSSGRPSLVATIVSMIIVLAVVSAFIIYSAMNVEWKTETASKGVAYWPFIAADDSGLVHMTYYEDGSLIHAVQTEEGWQTSVVHAGPIWGASPIVVDSSGHAHICYQMEGGDSLYSSLNWSLIYAKQTDDGWAASVISNKTFQGSKSMTLDQDGSAHIAFVRCADVIYSTEANGSWEEVTLIDHPDAPEYILATSSGSTSICVSQSGDVHVAVGYNMGFVGVFSNEGQEWVQSNLFNWDLTFDSVSIDAGADGSVAVAYYGYPAGEPNLRGVMLATRDSSGWNLDSAAPTEGVSLFKCALALDTNGLATIAWRDEGNQGSFLRVSEQTDDGWKQSVVSESGRLTSTSRSQLSVCELADGTTILAVDTGEAEYATDSVSLSDGLSSVWYLVPLCYGGGLLIWALATLTFRSMRGRDRQKESP